MPQSNKPVLDNDPDSFSTADNNSNSTDVFVNRVKYRDEIFPDAAPFSYFNFWEEDRYYGRINSLGNAVVLREDRLKQLHFLLLILWPTPGEILLKKQEKLPPVRS